MKITIPNVKNPMHLQKVYDQKTNFKELLKEKKLQSSSSSTKDVSLKSADLSIQKNFSDTVKNHESLKKSMKTLMLRTNYSPEKLLAIQYKTGFLFLREQMFCKTAELSANTFKNFTQMQV